MTILMAAQLINTVKTTKLYNLKGKLYAMLIPQ